MGYCKHIVSVIPLGGRVLFSNRLLVRCGWMGLHFHGWIDYNGITFSVGSC